MSSPDLSFTDLGDSAGLEYEMRVFAAYEKWTSSDIGER